jgi:chromosome segregation ATPase
MEVSMQQSNFSRESLPFLAIDSIAENSLFANRRSCVGHKKMTSFMSYKMKCKKVKKTHIEPSRAETMRAHYKENSQSSLSLSMMNGVRCLVEGVTPKPNNDSRIDEFQRTFNHKKSKLKELSISNSNLEAKIQGQELNIKGNNNELIRIKKEILKLTNELEHKSSLLKHLNDIKKTLSNSLREKEGRLEKRLTEKQKELNKTVKYRIETTRNESTITKITLDKYSKEIRNLENLIERRSINIRNMENTRQMMDDTVNQIQNKLNEMQRAIKRKRAEMEERRIRLRKREELIEHQNDPENLDLKILVMKMYEGVLSKKKKLQDKSLNEQFVLLKNLEEKVRAKEAATTHKKH